ncbi:hypothetical protein MKN91_004501 [Salmonella enterica]|uniref:hypothetical protein n=1 Tax=Escherichia coli TaxID=562 RepID=UPI0010099C7A|nr:hypothetical protein [Escherichia coli]EFC1147506.1 hypothetical protein [Escherichia coli]EIX5024893.1 hypothetical protein [Salmonella enterica]HCJ7760344.1 hypothetical protein [Citrobacter freundii]
MKESELGMLPGYIAQGVFAILIIALTQSSVMASTTAETEFTANIQSATCTLSGDTAYDLGTVIHGETKTYPPFQIRVNCNGGVVNSALHARVSKGSAFGAVTLALLLNNAPSSVAVTLREVDGNKNYIFLDGRLSLKGDGDRVHNIAPEVASLGADDTGELTGGIIFTLEYT